MPISSTPSALDLLVAIVAVVEVVLDTAEKWVHEISKAAGYTGVMAAGSDVDLFVNVGQFALLRCVVLKSGERDPVASNIIPV